MYEDILSQLDIIESELYLLEQWELYGIDTSDIHVAIINIIAMIHDKKEMDES